MSSPYQKAIDAGYTPEEIQSYLAESNPKFQDAQKAGYSLEEIANYLGEKPKTQTKKQYSVAGKKFGTEESSVLETLRHAGRSGLRAAETVLGAPRALGELGEKLIPEKMLKKGAEKIGLKEPLEKGLEFVKSHAPYKLFPEKQQVREAGKKLFGKTFEPENQWEEKADEIVEDATALALPGPQGKIRIAKPLLLSLGANVASEGVRQLGGTEKQQAYTKLGSILLGSMVNPGKADALKNELYDLARKSRPDRVKVVAPRLNTDLNAIERQLRKGGSEPWKDKIFKKIEELRTQISGNNVEVGELEKFKTPINNISSELYAERNISKPGIKSAQRFSKKLSKAVDKGLDEYGKTNPEWDAYYRRANQVHGAIAESHKARNVIERLAKKYGHHAILPLIGIGYEAGLAGLGTIAAGGALTAGVVGSGELVAKAFKSKEIQKLYSNLIQHALKEDATAVANTLDKLDDKLQDFSSQ